MSSNSFTWVTEGGDLATADWGCLAGRCASLCLQAAHGGRAAGSSGQWRKRIRGVRMFAMMRYTNWRPLPLPFISIKSLTWVSTISDEQHSQRWQIHFLVILLSQETPVHVTWLHHGNRCYTRCMNIHLNTRLFTNHDFCKCIAVCDTPWFGDQLIF